MPTALRTLFRRVFCFHRWRYTRAYRMGLLFGGKHQQVCTKCGRERWRRR